MITTRTLSSGVSANARKIRSGEGYIALPSIFTSARRNLAMSLKYSFWNSSASLRQ